MLEHVYITLALAAMNQTHGLKTSEWMGLACWMRSSDCMKAARLPFGVRRTIRLFGLRFGQSGECSSFKRGQRSHLRIWFFQVSGRTGPAGLISCFRTDGFQSPLVVMPPKRVNLAHSLFRATIGQAPRVFP